MSRAQAPWWMYVLAGRFTPLDRYLPSPPPPWQAFFARAFALDPAARPRSAPAWLADLERSLG